MNFEFLANHFSSKSMHLKRRIATYFNMLCLKLTIELSPTTFSGENFYRGDFRSLYCKENYFSEKKFVMQTTIG